MTLAVVIDVALILAIIFIATLGIRWYQDHEDSAKGLTKQIERNPKVRKDRRKGFV